LIKLLYNENITSDVMSLKKQAKTLSQQQQVQVLEFLKTTRYPVRNTVIFLLSVKAGLRAKEIACITWSMVTASDGQLTDAISLQNVATKGRSGGVVWLNNELKDALQALYTSSESVDVNDRVLKSERGNQLTAQIVVNMMFNWYQRMGFYGCSSHSGRRTFITNAAKKISSVGGSIRDVQTLARHRSLQMTQSYIENDIEAQKKIVQLV